MDAEPLFNLGSWRHLDGTKGTRQLRIPARHFVTHGVVVGMTGSGKTGLLTVVVEEAARQGIPTLIVDVKGDLPNLLLAYPDFSAQDLAPWLDSPHGASPESTAEAAAAAGSNHRQKLAEWNISPADTAAYCSSTHVRVLTPGAQFGEPIHVLSTLERRSSRWDTDPEGARDALSAAVSLVLRLVGRDPDPARSREHVLLSVLAERRLAAGKDANLADLMADLEAPPIDEIGALPLESFMKKAERRKLAASLNNLLASPTFNCWREGESLDVGAWLTPTGGRTPMVVVSVAHLDDEERALVLGVLLEEVLCWVRSLPGTQHLRALVVFDEVYGFLPPHPANPPTKRPMVALMKQARAFGVGVVVATQNPMDLDYRALSNAGLWFLGRLQTDADRERVLDGFGQSAGQEGMARSALEGLLNRLAPRWFVVRNVHATSGALLVMPRQTLTYLRGPMTRGEIKSARERAESAAMVAQKGAPTEP